MLTLLRTYLLVTLIFCMTMFSWAQNKEYYLRNDLILHECTIAGDTTGQPFRLCPWNANFTVVGNVGSDGLMIRFLNWYSDAELKEGSYEDRSWFLAPKTDSHLDPERKLKAERMNYDVTIPYGQERDRYFFITKSMLAVNGLQRVAKFSPTFGALVLPVKLRPQNGVVTKDISLGSVGGIRWQPRRRLDFYIAATVGLAITSITVDSASTNGKFKSKTESAGMTVPIGIMVQWEKVQWGIFTGWDMLFDTNKNDWKYQGKQWFSMGVGIGLYTEDGKARGQGQP